MGMLIQAETDSPALTNVAQTAAVITKDRFMTFLLSHDVPAFKECDSATVQDFRLPFDVLIRAKLRVERKAQAASNRRPYRF